MYVPICMVNIEPGSVIPKIEKDASIYDALLTQISYMIQLSKYW